MNALRLVLTTCLATATLTALPVAHAADPPSGQPCGWAVENSQHGLEETWTGVIYGGPLTASGATVVLRCSIHVDNDLHSGPAVVTETSQPGQGVAVLEPRPVSFNAPPTSSLVGCTEATVDGTTWYLGESGWTTDAASRCPNDDLLDEVFTAVDGLPLPDPVRFLIGGILCFVFGDACDVIGPALGYGDAAICPALVAAAPGVPGVVDIRPDGDLYVGGEWVWDCPPYAT